MRTMSHILPFGVIAFALLAGCAPKHPADGMPASPAPSSAAADAAGTPTSPSPEANAWGTPAPSPVAETPAAAPVAPAAPSADSLGISDDRALSDIVAMLATNDKGKAETALSRLSALEKSHPDSAIVHYNMGVAQNILGNTDQARKLWSRATEVDPAFGKAWLNLGVLSSRAGHMDIALATFQTGSRYAPADMDLRVATVAALRSLKRYDEAVTVAKAALAINSRALGIYTNLAQVYLNTNRLDLARFVLEKALIDIQSAGDDPQLHASLGEVYRRLGFDGDALSEFKKAIALDPYQLDALQFLARYDLDNRDYVDATPLWERVVALVPSDVGARLNLGISYRGEGRFEDAKRVYGECLRLDPRNPEPYRNLAVLYGDYLKDYDAAIAAIGDYRKAGGGPAAELDTWVTALQKDKKKAADKKAREEERARQDALKAAIPPEPAPAATPTPAPAPAPAEPSPWPGADPQPAPPPQPAPTEPPPSDNPWGGAP